MRIISGKLKFRQLPVIKNSNYRPSTSRFREALFSIIAAGNVITDGLTGKKILDVFAGTGSLGFEALSRGAKFVGFIDIEELHLASCRKFSDTAGVAEECHFTRADATKLPQAIQTYDIIIMDPPYNQQLIARSLNSLKQKGWLHENSVIIAESAKNEDLALDKSWRVLEERCYGKSKMTIIILD